MLMNNKCSAVTSIKVELTFDDGSQKERVIGVGDLIYVEYNANGLRNRTEGRVLNVSAVGTDPKSWYIIVDGSDDFDSKKVRFSPASILDCEIIRKADTLNIVQTPIGYEGVPFIRIVKGQLQYSTDGYKWKPIIIHRRDIIEEAEGTAPYDEGDIRPPHKCHRPPYELEEEYTDEPNDEYNEDDIQDSNY